MWTGPRSLKQALWSTHPQVLLCSLSGLPKCSSGLKQPLPPAAGTQAFFSLPKQALLPALPFRYLAQSFLKAGVTKESKHNQPQFVPLGFVFFDPI